MLQFKKGLKAEKKVEEMVPMIKEIRQARVLPVEFCVSVIWQTGELLDHFYVWQIQSEYQHLALQSKRT